jgi:drug/metabolite transporter (DMT)-like permease
VPVINVSYASAAALPHFRHHHVTTHVAITAVLALLSAMAFAFATVTQQRAAAQVSDSDARSGQLFVRLGRDPRWWGGTLGNGAGYTLQALALAYGSLLVVQPLLVTSLLFALPLGARLAHRRLPVSVWTWGLVLAVSLTLFVTIGNANNGASRGTQRGWLTVGAIAIPFLIGCLIAANRLIGAARASLLAIAVGILGGVLAVLTKAVVALISHGFVATVTSWETYGLLVIGAAGIWLQQLSFQAGALQASLPIITVLEPLIAGMLGLSLLHEQLRVSGPRMTLMIAAVLTMILATVALSRSSATIDMSEPDRIPDRVRAEHR